MLVRRHPVDCVCAACKRIWEYTQREAELAKVSKRTGKSAPEPMPPAVLPVFLPATASTPAIELPSVVTNDGPAYIAVLMTRASIAERIRECRALRRLKQEDLAERCGVSKGYIALIETARCNANTQMLEKILRAMGMTTVEFFRRVVR